MTTLAGGLTYDGLLKWRDDSAVWNLFGGYRGFNVGNAQHFGTLGASMSLPLGLDWLLLNGKLQGGYGASNTYFSDASLGLGLRAGFATLELDVLRHLTLQQSGGAAPVYINGPQATLKLSF
ncbi:hypothetical protein D3C72_1904930 [compost metagenome]